MKPYFKVRNLKILFFNDVFPELLIAKKALSLFNINKNTWGQKETLTLYGKDFSVIC